METPQVWAEVDLGTYGHNLRQLKGVTRPGARLMAVVKAEGYGHGALPVARAALKNGADALGVARLEEAVQLRQAGIDAPILIFGFTPANGVDALIDHDLIQTVFSRAMAEALSERAAARGKPIRAHVKVDTGMGRLGLIPNATTAGPAERDSHHEALSEVEAIVRLPGLEAEGIFTHFATADSADKSYAEKQLERFLDFCAQLEQRGVEFALRHAANSAALIDMPESHLDMVRPGIATYGLYPSADIQTGRVELRPALQWKTRIVHLKEVPAGFGVSYGVTYKTPAPTTLATVAVGYGDGLDRRLSSGGYMLVHAHRAPIVGRICMDLTLLDVGPVPGAEVGDEVVILGRQDEQSVSADEMASLLDTISYEIVSRITHRVPRIYVG